MNCASAVTGVYVAMLTKLLERFDPEQFRAGESPSDPIVSFEHEYPGKAGLSWVRHEHIGFGG